MKENINAPILISAVVIGLVVGYMFGQSNTATDEQSAVMHRMPDGSMMMNDHAHSGMEEAMHDMTGALVGKTGEVFDQEFLTQMIVHHEGAVDMAEMVLVQSKNPELRALAEDIIIAQTKEISMMRAWQKPLQGSTETPVVTVPAKPPMTDDTVACTMEAKICPDGSAVGRQGPNCEFAKCPGQ